MSITRWTTHPEAAAVIDELLDAARVQSDTLRQFEDRLLVMTSTRLGDWLDHIAVTPDEQHLRETGFELRDVTRGPRVWHHPAALLPAVVEKENGATVTLGLRVDAIENAAQSNGITDIDGGSCAAYRSAELFTDHRIRVLAVERHSWKLGVVTEDVSKETRAARTQAHERWLTRDRLADMASVLANANELVELVGPDLAGTCAMDAEREYWMSRNTSARLQFDRQNQLGLGWGNHDHYTFRSSRPDFAGLLEIMRTLGFEEREIFHAGAEAGWGAQVMEHPSSGYVAFTDVDLAPDELDVDFSQTLPEKQELGTVGLWCALHGESIQGSGMHHMAARYDFERLRIDLPVRHLKPFSELPYLHQAFTEPEAWQVSKDVLDSLLERGAIDDETRAQFAEHGAAGSHLENIARGDGYKGFNQRNVSETMKATDPRILRGA